jgi:selenide,water dikinase
MRLPEPEREQGGAEPGAEQRERRNAAASSAHARILGAVQRTPAPNRAAPIRRVVLVGAGHAHIQVLRAFAMQPEPGLHLTLVVDQPLAVYSGMVPGFAAGEYEARELEIDAVPLARLAGARCVVAPALRVDPVARSIEVEGRAPIAYDFASLDVGSSLRGLERPGVAELALATRPIRRFVDSFAARIAALAGHARPVEIAVIGGGAAGVELALCSDARLRRAGARARIRLVCDGERILPGASAALAAEAQRELAARGIGTVLGARALAVRARVIEIESGGQRSELACDLALWATGAAPPALIASSPLPSDERGFARVDATLGVIGCPGLFAAGDCASLDGAPWVTKAGVFAVREGPLLAANLRAALRGNRLQRYRPQRDFLALLNLGDGRALGGKWGMALRGRRVWRLKDSIDRRFVSRFEVLDSRGRARPGYSGRFRAAEAAAAMECGGCAAKVGPAPLARALERLGPAPGGASVLCGLDARDDAALLALPRGELVIASIDAFRAFCDDPWLVGAAAAVNAVSDLYCKGGEPRHALAFVTVPESPPDGEDETLYQVLAGMRAALAPLGVTLLGGHSTRGAELFAGLSITGELARREDWWSQRGARAGDALILTKPLGTGVLLAADRMGRARGEWVQRCHASLLRANAAAARAARAVGGVHAATDVSGFGLAGHLAALLAASDLRAELQLSALPALPGALELLAQGLRSTYHTQNAVPLASRGIEIDPGLADDPRSELLFDPQTCGGLLLCVDPARGDACIDALRAVGDSSTACIGRIVAEPAAGA